VHIHRTYVKTLKALRYSGQHIGRCLLLFVVLAHESRGVELQLRGLNIEQLLVPNAPNSAATVPVDAKYLDDMLRLGTFSAAVIDEQVTVILTEHLTEFSDTDESIEEEGKIQKGVGASFLKFTSKFSGDRSKIRLKPSEINQNQTPGQITEDLCRKLAKDAFRIANAHHNARTREATTCLCVVLRDEEQYAKRLVFHNSTDEMQPSLRAKANELMYGIRNAYLAHAEAQFIDFLLYRARQRDKERDTDQKKKAQYTHILGMGCSRKHCQECDALCKLFLGHEYLSFTAATEKLNDGQSMPCIEDLTQGRETHLHMTVPVQKSKIVFQGAAVRSGGQHSTNYRLSKSMQEAISDKSGLTDLDFSRDRFNPIDRRWMLIEDESMEIVGEYEAEDVSKEAPRTAEKKRKAT
jgi:hypothetical protein